MALVFDFKAILVTEFHDLKKIFLIQYAACRVHDLAFIITEVVETVLKDKLLNFEELVHSFCAEFPF